MAVFDVAFEAEGGARGDAGDVEERFGAVAVAEDDAVCVGEVGLAGEEADACADGVLADERDDAGGECVGGAEHGERQTLPAGQADGLVHSRRHRGGVFLFFPPLKGTTRIWRTGRLGAGCGAGGCVWGRCGRCGCGDWRVFLFFAGEFDSSYLCGDLCGNGGGVSEGGVCLDVPVWWRDAAL